MLYRYYMSTITAMLGTLPLNKNLVRVEDYPNSRYNDDVGEYVWGYVEYLEPLPEKEVRRYGLLEDRR